MMIMSPLHFVKIMIVLKIIFIVYRYRVDFDLVIDPSAELNDADLTSFIADMQVASPNVGQYLVMGRLRSQGYKVSRERIRSALIGVSTKDNEQMHCVKYATYFYIEYHYYYR